MHEAPSSSASSSLSRRLLRLAICAVCILAVTLVVIEWFDQRPGSGHGWPLTVALILAVLANLLSILLRRHRRASNEP